MQLPYECVWQCQRGGGCRLTPHALGKVLSRCRAHPKALQGYNPWARRGLRSCGLLLSLRERERGFLKKPGFRCSRQMLLQVLSASRFARRRHGLEVLLQFFEEIVPADYKLHRIFQGVEYLAQGVFERPSQPDYAV